MRAGRGWPAVRGMRAEIRVICPIRLWLQAGPARARRDAEVKARHDPLLGRGREELRRELANELYQDHGKDR